MPHPVYKSKILQKNQLQEKKRRLLKMTTVNFTITMKSLLVSLILFKQTYIKQAVSWIHIQQMTLDILDLVAIYNWYIYLTLHCWCHCIFEQTTNKA